MRSADYAVAAGAALAVAGLVLAPSASDGPSEPGVFEKYHPMIWLLKRLKDDDTTLGDVRRTAARASLALGVGLVAVGLRARKG